MLAEGRDTISRRSLLGGGRKRRRTETLHPEDNGDPELASGGGDVPASTPYRTEPPPSRPPQRPTPASTLPPQSFDQRPPSAFPGLPPPPASMVQPPGPAPLPSTPPQPQPLLLDTPAERVEAPVAAPREAPVRSPSGFPGLAPPPVEGAPTTSELDAPFPVGTHPAPPLAPPPVAESSQSAAEEALRHLTGQDVVDPSIEIDRSALPPVEDVVPDAPFGIKELGFGMDRPFSTTEERTAADLDDADTQGIPTGLPDLLADPPPEFVAPAVPEEASAVRAEPGGIAPEVHQAAVSRARQQSMAMGAGGLVVGLLLGAGAALLFS